ncbi:hypothetical protein MJC1_04173 [Methylocystis sp. MJC1]|jgi:transposase|nr:hypothetical protein MJC1_04173 [Methylocystis sp. MJC1]MBU6529045.1 hypothetical protein [Methylocystis sp. MJC1]
MLIISASSVVRWAAGKRAPAGSWLASMIARKPAMLVRVALANKMARFIWALMNLPSSGRGVNLLTIVGLPEA